MTGEVPSALVTETSTEPEGPEGAAMVRVVDEVTAAVPAEVVPNLTVSPGLKLVPVTVTEVVAAPAVGLTAVTVGAA